MKFQKFAKSDDKANASSKKGIYIWASAILPICLLTSQLVILSCQSIPTKQRLISKERNTIIETKVKTRTQLKVQLDKDGNAKWQKPIRIDSFDMRGLVVLSLFPKYELAERPPTPPGGLTIEEINNNLLSLETDIPLNYYDSSLFEYDKNDDQIKLRNTTSEISRPEKNFLVINRHENTTLFKYDNKGNWIEKCFSYGIEEDICNYRIYEYDNTGRVVTRIDSVGPRSGKYNQGWGRKEIIYEYDANGNLIYDGDNRRKYNAKNELIEEIVFPERDGGELSSFEYDAAGKIQCITTRRVISSTWNPTTNTTVVNKTATLRKYFYYNEIGLTKQIKEIDENNRLVSLENYKYTFY
jgi:YD repeat-containing protein